MSNAPSIRVVKGGNTLKRPYYVLVGGLVLSNAYGITRTFSNEAAAHAAGAKALKAAS